MRSMPSLCHLRCEPICNEGHYSKSQSVVTFTSQMELGSCLTYKSSEWFCIVNNGLIKKYYKNDAYPMRKVKWSEIVCKDIHLYIDSVCIAISTKSKMTSNSLPIWKKYTNAQTHSHSHAEKERKSEYIFLRFRNSKIMKMPRFRWSMI